MVRDWLTLAEAAELVGRDRRTVQRWRAAGLLVTWRPIRTRLYQRASLLAVEARMTGDT